jgi:anhydro-N-acetylmuramic acid kinase
MRHRQELPMNPNIAQLHRVAAQGRRRIIGLMSGTSLDGLDVALCDIEGAGPTTRLTLEAFRTVPYDDRLRADVRRLFAQEQVDLRFLARFNGTLARLQSGMILDCLAQWGVSPADVDLIASHGQTVMHAPAAPGSTGAPATLQIGDGDHMAVLTGITTVSDFRQKHVAAGGEGAPLAVYGDALLFQSPAEPRILLNMGGIANFTALPQPGSGLPVVVTDTGPGNTLLDALARVHLPNLGYDRDARLGRAGQMLPALLAALKDHPFFAAPLPKTTGPELFNLDYVTAAQARSGTCNAGPADLMATLTRFSAETIADEVLRHPLGKTAPLFISGGGVHNPLLMGLLGDLLVRPIARTDSLGIPADAKEAVLFAVLANEAIAGDPSALAEALQPGTPTVALGKISFAT